MTVECIDHPMGEDEQPEVGNKEIGIVGVRSAIGEMPFPQAKSPEPTPRDRDVMPLQRVHYTIGRQQVHRA